MKSFYLLLLLTLGIHAENYSVVTENRSRFIDMKDEYGKNCEKYSFIPAMQRVQYLHHAEFLLGDLLSDTLAIPTVEEGYLSGSYASRCEEFDMDISRYEYEEELEYLSDDVITIQVFQYQYGAGAAHGNGHSSHYVYERDYGMELDWENLFARDDAFDLYIIRRVVKEIAEKEFLDYFKAREQILNYRHPGYFGIEKEGLVIQYGKYEIASGAAGFPSLTIPKKVLKKYMKPGMYEKCFGKETKRIVEARNDH